MKIFVTGGSGVIGSYLIKILTEKGYEVYSPSSRLFKIEDENHWRIQMNIIKPDFIIHLAAMTDVDKCEREHINAYTANSLPSFHINKYAPKKCTVIYISTASVFGEQGRMMPEEYCTEFKPVSEYSKSKLLGENILNPYRNFKRLIILRLGWVFGGGKNDKKFVGKIYEKIKNNEDIKAVDDLYGQPVYAKNIAGFIDMVISKPFKDDRYVLHMANQKEVSRFMIAEKIKDILFSKSEITPVSNCEFKLDAARPQKELISSSYTEQLLECEFMNWEEALENYIYSELKTNY